MHHQRNPSRTFEEVHLVPETALAEHVAVIGQQHDDGVVRHAQRVQRRHQLASPLVDVRDVAVVRTAGVANILFGDLGPVHRAGFAQANRVRVGGHVGGGDHGHRDVDAFVAVPVLPTGHVGVVWVGEAGDQQPWPFIGVAGDVVQCADCVVADLVVEQQLVGHLGDAGTGDAVHVVVPPVDAFVRGPPVGGPPEVGRVDVGGAALLEAVQLIWSDEVHLAAQDGAVAGGAGVVRKRRDRARQVRGVVVSAGRRRQLTGHHAAPRRRAQGAVRVRRVEDHSVGREAIYHRRFHGTVAVATERRRRELVVHHDEHVGAGLGHIVDCVSRGLPNGDGR